jgi:hypothetical protein
VSALSFSRSDIEEGVIFIFVAAQALERHQFLPESQSRAAIQASAQFMPTFPAYPRATTLAGSRMSAGLTGLWTKVHIAEVYILGFRCVDFSPHVVATRPARIVS